MSGTIKHGMAYTPEWYAWKSMRSRCRSPRDPEYNGYGGRGITTCPEWESFGSFYNYLGPRPSAKHSLERIDNNGNYEPGNVRWASPKEQANNRRSNRILSVGDKALTLAEWADEVGIGASIIYKRLEYGWPLARALAQPLRAPRRRPTT